MKAKTLIKFLEPYKEADIFFGNDEVGSVFFNDCYIDTDKRKILIFPKGKELIYKNTKLDSRINVK